MSAGKKQQFTLKGLPYKGQVRAGDPVKITNGANVYSRYTHHRTRTTDIMVGDFTITLDVAAIAEYMALRAASSKSGKSAWQGDLIVCKATRREKVREEVQHIEIPAGYTEVQQ